jgi:hypothetical protein
MLRIADLHLASAPYQPNMANDADVSHFDADIPDEVSLLIVAKPTRLPLTKFALATTAARPCTILRLSRCRT